MVTGWIQKFLNCVETSSNGEARINLVEKLFRSRNVIEVNDEKQVVGCDLIIVESFCLIKFC